MKAENFITIQGWMRTELNLKGNDLIVFAIIYGFCQDDESVFNGSLQYLADWCGATKQGIQKNLKHLVELGLIEKNTVIKQGNKVCHYTTKLHTYTTKLPGTIQLSCSDNIDNKIDKKGILINKNTYCKKLVKKKSLYQKEMDEIQLFTKDIKIQKALTDFLNLQLEIYKEQGKVYYTNIFKNRLNKLREDFKEDEWLDVIKHATSKGWQNFYPIKETKSSKKKKAYNDGVSCEQYTDEEWKEIEQWQREQEENGEQIEF